MQTTISTTSPPACETNVIAICQIHHYAYQQIPFCYGKLCEPESIQEFIVTSSRFEINDQIIKIRTYDKNGTLIYIYILNRPLKNENSIIQLSIKYQQCYIIQ